MPAAQDWCRDKARAGLVYPFEFVVFLDVFMDVTHAGTRLRNSLGFDMEQRRKALAWAEGKRQFLEQAHNLV